MRDLVAAGALAADFVQEGDVDAATLMQVALGAPFTELGRTPLTIAGRSLRVPQLVFRLIIRPLGPRTLSVGTAASVDIGRLVAPSKVMAMRPVQEVGQNDKSSRRPRPNSPSAREALNFDN